MLTEKHLAVVRAALRYLDEEVSPHGFDVLNHYLDARGLASAPAMKDITGAQRIFDAVELGYALVDSTGIVIESKRLIPASPRTELAFQSELSLIASVLVPIR